MALVLYVGGAESDSFISVTQADTYINGLPEDTTGWASLSTAEKEFRLQMAAHLMGHLPLRGYQVFRNQNLCFPRTCQAYQRRFAIPEEVKKAQAFIAYSVVHRGIAARPGIGEGLDASWGTPSRVSLAGLVAVSFKGAPLEGNLLDNLMRAQNAIAYLLLKPYLSQIRGRSIPDEDELQGTSTTTVTS